MGQDAAGAYFELEGRVFIYSAASLAPLGVVSSPDPTGSDQFGVDLAVDPVGDLYVAAKWADVGKKREAGKVFLFEDGLICDGSTCESVNPRPLKFTLVETGTKTWGGTLLPPVPAKSPFLKTLGLTLTSPCLETV